MKYDELIAHILSNSIRYLEEYDNQELTEREKGILLGLWMDVDSIKNQLTMEQLETSYKLDKIMEDLQKLINK